MFGARFDDEPVAHDPKFDPLFAVAQHIYITFVCGMFIILLHFPELITVEMLPSLQQLVLRDGRDKFGSNLVRIGSH